MIRRNTWIVMAIFIAGLAGTIWYSQREPSSNPAGEISPTVEPLWFLPEADIEEMLIEDIRNGARVRARRQQEVGWILLQPDSELADVARIERAVTALQLIQPVERFRTDDMAPFGLDQPNFQIVLSLRDGSNRGIEIGRQAPTGDVYYARVGSTDEVLFLRASSIQSALDLLEVPPVVTASPESLVTATPTGG